MIGIYKITNKVNGKVYIGQSDNITARWQKHRKTAFNPNNRCYNYPLYRAIRKYGLDNFEFEIIEECPVEELDNKELLYISKYKAFGQGYNQTAGGIHARRYCRFTDKEVDEIILRLKTTTDSMGKISKDYKVANSTISAINRGEYYRRNSETYPIRDATYLGRQVKKHNSHPHKTKAYTPRLEKRTRTRPEPAALARLVVEKGFEAVGREYNVSGKTISKWCQNYGLPYKRKELTEWYRQQMGISVPTRKKTPISEIIKPVAQIDMQTGQIISIFPSINAARKTFSDSRSPGISEVCRGKRKSAYGYFWKYVEKDNT